MEMISYGSEGGLFMGLGFRIRYREEYYSYIKFDAANEFKYNLG